MLAFERTQTDFGSEKSWKSPPMCTSTCLCVHVPNLEVSPHTKRLWVWRGRGKIHPCAPAHASVFIYRILPLYIIYYVFLRNKS